MNFVFFGTPEPAVEILESLKKAGFVPSLVITNPDKPQGRNLKLSPPPAKEWAMGHHIPYLQPTNLKDQNFLKQLATSNADVFVVVAYGAILPRTLLKIPRRGTLNIHYSLLPKYRGASPVESQILTNDRETGVSIILLDEKMDHGPIIAQQRLEFQTKAEDQKLKEEVAWPPKASELRTALNKIAGNLLAKTLPAWIEGAIEAKIQNHALATYTKKFAKVDGEINLADDPYKNFLKIRAFEDSIGTYFFSTKNNRQVRVLIKNAELRDGNLFIIRVIPESRQEMGYEEFLQSVDKK